MRKKDGKITLKDTPLSPMEKHYMFTLLRESYREGNITSVPIDRRSCSNIPRPCPFVGCIHSTYLDVDSKGRIKLSNNAKYPWEVNPRESCVLDIVEDNPEGVSNERIGSILGFSRETARLIELNARSRLNNALDLEDLNAILLDRTQLINTAINKTKNLSYEHIQSILFRYPTLDFHTILTGLTKENKFNSADLDLLSYYKVIPFEDLPELLGIDFNQILNRLDTLGYLDKSLPGEYTEEQTKRMLRITRQSVNVWIEAGLSYREYCGERFFSRSGILDFLDQNAKYFYLLKRRVFEQENDLRLDTIKHDRPS